MTTKAEKKIVATIETKLGYEKKNVKGIVTSVRDYVVVGGNLWVNPDLALALSKLPDLGAKLSVAANECIIAAKHREAVPKPTKSTKVATTAVPTMSPDAMAMFAQFMAMMKMQAATTAQVPVADVEPEPQADPDKRESAKERADRLRERSE